MSRFLFPVFYSPQAGRGTRGQRFAISSRAILGLHDGRAGRRNRAGIPGLIGSNFENVVPIHHIGDVAVRVGDLGRPAEIVHICGCQMQAPIH